MYLTEVIPYLLFLGTSSLLGRVNDGAECYIIHLAVSLAFLTSVLRFLTYSIREVAFESVFEVIILSGKLIKPRLRVLYFMLLKLSLVRLFPRSLNS